MSKLHFISFAGMTVDLHPQLCLQSPCVVYIMKGYTQPCAHACKKMVKICRLYSSISLLQIQTCATIEPRFILEFECKNKSENMLNPCPRSDHPKYILKVILWIIYIAHANQGYFK